MTEATVFSGIISKLRERGALTPKCYTYELSPEEAALRETGVTFWGPDNLFSAVADRDLMPLEETVPITANRTSSTFRYPKSWIFFNGDQFRRALRAYMPEQDYNQWYKTFCDQLFNSQILELNFDGVVRNNLLHLKMGLISALSQGSFFGTIKQLDAVAIDTLTDAPGPHHDKIGMPHLQNLLKVMEGKPLLEAISIMQMGNLQFLEELTRTLLNGHDFNQKEIAHVCRGISRLTQTFSDTNFLAGPAVWIAAAYEKRVGSDYKQPMVEKDFLDGIENLYKNGGFYSDIYETKVQCPYAKRAMSAIRAKSLWNIYQKLEANPFPDQRLVVKQYATQAIKLIDEATAKKDRDLIYSLDTGYKSELSYSNRIDFLGSILKSESKYFGIKRYFRPIIIARFRRRPHNVI